LYGGRSVYYTIHSLARERKAAGHAVTNCLSSLQIRNCLDQAVTKVCEFAVELPCRTTYGAPYGYIRSFLLTLGVGPSCPWLSGWRQLRNSLGRVQWCEEIPHHLNILPFGSNRCWGKPLEKQSGSRQAQSGGDETGGLNLMRRLDSQEPILRLVMLPPDRYCDGLLHEPALGPPSSAIRKWNRR
jgi:hypothetical protein